MQVLKHIPSSHGEECHLIRRPCLCPEREEYFFDCMKRDYREGHRIGKGCIGGVGMFESSSVELEEKREPKRVALSVGETAIVSSERKSEGKVERHKLLEIVFTKDQKDLLVEEYERLSHFFWIKECFASQITCLR